VIPDGDSTLAGWLPFFFNNTLLAVKNFKYITDQNRKKRYAGLERDNPAVLFLNCGQMPGKFYRFKFSDI